MGLFNLFRIIKEANTILSNEKSSEEDRIYARGLLRRARAAIAAILPRN